MTTPLRIRLPVASHTEFVDRYRAHLARGGIFIATRSPKPEGTELAFELVLKDGERVLRGGAVVLKVRGEGQSAPPGMMLRFRKLDVPSKTLVERLAAEKKPSAASEHEQHDLPSEVEVQLEFTGEASAPDAAHEPRAEAEPTSPEPRVRRRISLEVPAQESPAPPAPALGIEVGTVVTRVARVEDGHAALISLGPDEAPHVPTLVALTANGELRYGWDAAAEAQPWSGWVLGIGLPATSPRATALVGNGPFPLVPLSEGDVAWQIGNRIVDGKALLTGFLAHLRTRLEERLGISSAPSVVLSVPSSFGHRQRAVFLDAAANAGFRVMRFLQGTSGAALAAVHGLSLPRKRIVVCTLAPTGADAAIIELTGNELEVVNARGHAQHPSMVNGAGSDAAVALVHRLLEEAGLQPQGIDELVLAGDPERVAQVQALWEAQAGKAPFPGQHLEDRAVRGAALLAFAAARPGSGPAFASAQEVLTRPFDLVVEGARSQRIFELGTHLPAEKSVELPCEEGKAVALALFQSDEEGEAEPVGLAAFRPDRTGTFVVKLSLDVNGVMTLALTPPAGLATRSLILDSQAPVPEALKPKAMASQASVPRKGLLGGLKKLLGR